MRRYKIVACILLILSVFGFVLAAPIPVQEVREACADAVDGGDNVIIGLGKRVDLHLIEDDDPSLAQSQQEPSSSSDGRLTLGQYQGSSSAPNHASGTNPNPSFSSEGEDKLIQPGTSTEIQPASSSYAKSVSWAPSKKVLQSSGEIYTEMLPPDPDLPLPPEGEGYQPNQPASSSNAKLVSWAPSKKVLQPSGEIYFEMLPPDPDLPLPPEVEGHQPIQPASSSNAKLVSWAPSKKVLQPSGEIYTEMLPPDPDLPLPPAREGYLLKMAAQQSPWPPEPQNTLSKLIGKLKFKFWRRISGTAGGVVTEG